MTAMHWLSVCAYAALAIALGHGVLRLLRLHRAPLLDTWAAALLCGQLVLLVATLSTIALPWRIDQLLPVLVVAAAASTAVAVRAAVRARSAPRPWWALLTFAAATALFPGLLLSAHATAVVDWDARSIWMLHGKALWLHGRVDAAFFGNPQFWWSNLDYPLLLPAQAAWSSLLQGRWSDVGCKAHLWLQFAAWFHLLATLLRRRFVPTVATLPATALVLVQGRLWAAPAFGFVSGGADLHYVMPFTLAALALAARDRRQLLPFAALMLIWALNAKNEAAAYLGAAAAAAAAWWLWRHRRELGTALPLTLRAQRALVLLGLGLGALPLLAWRLFARAQPIPGGFHFEDRIARLPSLLLERGGDVLAAIVEHHELGTTGNLLLAWTALALAAGVVRRRHGLGRADALVTLLFLLPQALLFPVFALTPNDPAMHMSMSMSRLLLLPQFALAALCLLRLEHLWRGRPPTAAV